jgi:NADPH:quinone reductase-like Zn-dependent oxidoreductase
MPLKLPAILGRDIAGEVVKVGESVYILKPGQMVMGLVFEGYAEFVAVKAEILAKIPDGLDVQRAAALPLVLLTGTQLMENAVGPKSGDTVLVTGALGGVGRTAVFVAKQRGARVIAGVRANQKNDAQSLGADSVVAIDDESEIASLPALDAIADTVNGETIARLLPKLKEGGVLGSVLGKPKAAEGRNIQVNAFMAQPDALRLHQLAESVAKGQLTIPIAKTFPLSEAAAAHQIAEKGAVNGKVLLIP